MAQRKTYAVALSYTQSLDQLLASGKYDFVNPAMTPTNFPLSKDGPARVDITLVSFDAGDGQPDIASAQLMLRNNGFRPATLRELLTLGNSYPDLQLDTTIIAAGTTWKTTNGHVAVAALEGLKSKHVRSVEVFGAGVLGWRKHILFAAVREPK